MSIWQRWFRLEHPTPKPKPKPKPKPPPPPPARSRWLNPPLKGKVVYFTWGLETGQFNPDSLAAFAARCGARAAAVQITDANFHLHAEVKLKLHARNIAYLVWERSDQMSWDQVRSDISRLDPDGYLADVEGAMSDPSIAAKVAEAWPSMYRALCATGALDISIPGGAVAASKPWIDAGWDISTQDYVVDNANATPDGEDNFAYWRNWPLNAIGKRHYPVLECDAEGSKPFADQRASVESYRDSDGHLCVGIYDAEQLSDESIAAFAAA